MLEKLYRLENFLYRENKREYVYKIFNKIANIIVRKQFKYFPYKIGINCTEVRKQKIIISLTSFPARIDDVWICIESLFRQTVKADKIILWLAREQFPKENELPVNLIKMKEKGLEIRFCDDLKAHKKYFYAIKDYPNDIIITVDDDVYYPNYTVEKLYKMYEENSQYIYCNRAHKIKITNGIIDKYNNWSFNYDFANQPSWLLFPTGVGGVLYPPQIFDDEVFNKSNIVELCQYADDIWLKFMALKNNKLAIKTQNYPNRLFTIGNSQLVALSDINVNDNQNDVQLKKIIDVYGDIVQKWLECQEINR